MNGNKRRRSTLCRICAVRLSGYLVKLPPGLGVTDIIEIGLISFFIYQFMVWIKFTRAYTLLKEF